MPVSYLINDPRALKKFLDTLHYEWHDKLGSFEGKVETECGNCEYAHDCSVLAPRVGVLIWSALSSSLFSCWERCFRFHLVCFLWLRNLLRWCENTNLIWKVTSSSLQNQLRRKGDQTLYCVGARQGIHPKPTFSKNGNLQHEVGESCAWQVEMPKSCNWRVLEDQDTRQLDVRSSQNRVH